MSFIKGLLVALAILGYNRFWAQDESIIYFQPNLSLNYKVSPGYTHNFSLSNRNFILQQNNVLFRGRHLDISHFSTFKTTLSASFGAGVMYRSRRTFESGSDDEIRLTEQYNITSQPHTIRYGHRFRAEQRLLPGLTLHRFRYRFTLDFPLEGQEVDINEAYLILNTEALLSMAESRKPQYDQRLTAAIGWVFSSLLQLQTGIEHRWENYTGKTQPVLFLTSSLVFSL